MLDQWAPALVPTLIISVLMALLSGFVLSLNTVSVQYTIMTNFELD